MPRRRRSRVLLGLAILAMVPVGAEVTLRVTGATDLPPWGSAHQLAFNAAEMLAAVDDPEIAYVNRPLAATTIDGVVYRHDEHGWRLEDGRAGGPEGGIEGGIEDGLEDRTAAGVQDVVFLGDSTTYGFGAPASGTLPAQTAAALGGRIRALNLGVLGYGTRQETALYIAQRDSFPAARLVVLVFFPNDVSKLTYLWDSRRRLAYPDPLPLPFALKSWLWQSSTLYRAVVSRAGISWAISEQAARAEPARREWALAAIRHLAEVVRADGRELLVASLPEMLALDVPGEVPPGEYLGPFCRELGVPFVDLLPAFLAERERQIAAREARGGQPVTAEQRAAFLSQFWVPIPDDHHLNAAGNRLAAAPLAAAIAPLLTD